MPRRRGLWILALLAAGIIGCLLLVGPEDASRSAEQYQESHQVSSDEVTRWLRNRLTNDSTFLGNWLLNQDGDVEDSPAKTANASFLILVWEHGPFLERRHLRRFSRSKKHSPWDKCSVSNCRLSYASSDLHGADAVIFHLHLTKSAGALPKRRNYEQRWIFLTDESPFNTFLQRNGQRLSDYDGLFNWSMTYRMDSDVPVPYGRTVLAISNELAEQERRERKGLVVVLGSNCSGKNNRWSYVKELRKALGDSLQILGRCLNGNRTACPGHFDSDCPLLGDFKFYLAFENSNCREYLSEKLFWNAYSKRAVPIIMGAPRSDCKRLLPPGSYLHVDDFANAASLAGYLLYLDADDDEYERLHAWRTRYRVLNEHGYFGSASKHFCRVCEALNYNSPESKVYEDLEAFWSVERDCESVT